MEKNIQDRQVFKQGTAARVLDGRNLETQLSSYAVTSFVTANLPPPKDYGFIDLESRIKDTVLKEVFKSSAPLFTSLPLSTDGLLVDSQEPEMTKNEKESSARIQSSKKDGQMEFGKRIGPKIAVLNDPWQGTSTNPPDPIHPPSQRDC